jgi:hypothetical protein
MNDINKYAGINEINIAASSQFLMKATIYAVMKKEKLERQIPTFSAVPDRMVWMSLSSLDATSPGGRLSKKDGSCFIKVVRYDSRSL